MTGSKPPQRIGVLSPGLGGLPALRECMLVRPDAEFIVLVDRALVAPPADHYDRLPPRVRQALGKLHSLGAVQIVAPGVPTGCAGPSGLDPEFVEFSESLLELELRQAADLTESGRVAFVLTPALAESWPYVDLRSRAAGLSIATCPSPTLGPVLDRMIERDEISIAVIDEVARSVREAGADVVVFGCPHAHLVEDVFRRALGGSVAIVRSPSLTAGLIGPSELGPPAPGTPPVSLVSASGEAGVAEANLYLQAPITGFDRVELPPLSGDLSMRDRISLAYAAFDLGDIEAAIGLFTPDATVASEIPGWPCPVALASALCASRRCMGKCVSTIEAFMSSGEFVGVTGWRIATDAATGEASQERFSHLFKLRGELVSELRLVDPGPPWDDPDLEISPAH